MTQQDSPARVPSMCIGSRFGTRFLEEQAQTCRKTTAGVLACTKQFRASRSGNVPAPGLSE